MREGERIDFSGSACQDEETFFFFLHGSLPQLERRIRGTRCGEKPSPRGRGRTRSPFGYLAVRSEKKEIGLSVCGRDREHVVVLSQLEVDGSRESSFPPLAETLSQTVDPALRAGKGRLRRNVPPPPGLAKALGTFRAAAENCTRAGATITHAVEQSQ